MTGLILLIVGCAAIAVLLACLKGFRQAQRHKKVEGVFVNVAKSKEQFPERRNSGSTGFPHRKPDQSREPATHQVCAGTAALVEMAIILGSRTLYSAPPAGSINPNGARLRHNASASSRHRVRDPQSRVQPSKNF